MARDTRPQSAATFQAGPREAGRAAPLARALATGRGAPDPPFSFGSAMGSAPE